MSGKDFGIVFFKEQDNLVSFIRDFILNFCSISIINVAIRISFLFCGG